MSYFIYYVNKGVLHWALLFETMLVFLKNIM